MELYGAVSLTKLRLIKPFNSSHSYGIPVLIMPLQVITSEKEWENKSTEHEKNNKSRFIFQNTACNDH